MTEPELPKHLAFEPPTFMLYADAKPPDPRRLANVMVSLGDDGHTDDRAAWVKRVLPAMVAAYNREQGEPNAEARETGDRVRQVIKEENWFGMLLDDALVHRDKWEAITRAICGIEIGPSFTAFSAVHEKLIEMVGPDGVFRWPGAEESK